MLETITNIRPELLLTWFIITVTLLIALLSLRDNKKQYKTIHKDSRGNQTEYSFISYKL